MPLAPKDSGFDVFVEPFVELPVGNTSAPARVNEITFLGDILFVLEE